MNKQDVIEYYEDCLKTTKQVSVPLKFSKRANRFNGKTVFTVSRKDTSFLIAKHILFRETMLNENTDEEIKNTIRHEVAHLICGRKHGSIGVNHGHLWKEEAIKLNVDISRY